MDKLFFSVIIPTYRDERLKLCLFSLASQSLPNNNFEVIVVNNDPEDLIDVNLEHYKSLDIKIVYEPVAGSYAARNTGILYASGKILAFTDSDCIPDVDWLQNAKRYFDKDIDTQIGILA